jgi:hypothetical protein
MAKSFQAALTTPVDPEGNSLNQTMTTDQAQAPGTQGDFDITPYDDAIKQAEGRLNDIFTQMPNIDFKAKYEDIMNQVQNRQVPPAPNPITSFAYMMGSPNAAPALLHEKVLKRQQVQEQKEMDMMQLNEHLLQGAIQQEIAQGNFKTALSQSEKLAELQKTLDDRKRALDMQDWIKQQGIKTENATKLVKIRAKEIADRFHLTERMQLEDERQMTDLVQALLGQKDAFGRPVHTIDSAVGMATQAMISVHGTSGAFARGQNPPIKEKPAAPMSEKDKANAILNDLRKGKGKNVGGI